MLKCDLCQRDTPLKHFTDEQDGGVLRLFVEIRRRSAEHSAGDILGTIVLSLLLAGFRQTDRDGTYLKTLTDHPRLETSLLNVPSNEARVSDVRVLESIVVQR